MVALFVPAKTATKIKKQDVTFSDSLLNKPHLTLEIRVGDGIKEDVIFGRAEDLEGNFDLNTIKMFLRTWGFGLKIEGDDEYLAYRKDRIIHRAIERFGIE